MAATALMAEVSKSVHAKEAETIIADWLFVQNAKGITYADGMLTLKEVNPVTVMFTDRPVLAPEYMTIKRFIPLSGVKVKTAFSRILLTQPFHL